MKTKQVQQSRRKKSKALDLNFYLAAIGIVLLLLTTYIGARLYSSDKILIPLSVVALMSGLLFEYKRLAQKWSKVLYTALGAFIFSFLVFLPRKKEPVYILENHIEMWPYVFCLIFIVIAIVIYEKETVPKLTEGITLLQSLAVVYWVIDLGIVNIEHFLIKASIAVGVALSLFSLYHAFSYKVLSRTSMLTLSIWSSIVMVLFAFDNTWNIYQNEQIEASSDPLHKVYVAGQFFLLGISSIYMVQNFIMAVGFLPGKRTFFNKQYFRDLKVIKRLHITRYSSEQVNRGDSLFCVLFASAIFGLNYYFDLLPRNFVIWAVFLFFPFILSLLKGYRRNMLSSKL